jgi:hypothetical protein
MKRGISIHRTNLPHISVSKLTPRLTSKNISIPSVRIFIICYDNYTENYAKKYLKYSWAYPIRLRKTIKYLEAIMYLEWLEENYDLWKDFDYVGTLSWKFDQKIPIPNMNNILLQCKSQNIDIYPFYFIPSLPNINYTINNKCSKEFKYLWINLLKKLGYSEEESLNINIKQFYSNYWICKRELLLNYCTFCKMVRDTLENSPELQEYVNIDSKYGGKLPTERLLEIFEKPYYTLHPFIFEDMPCFYFWVKGFKVG